MKIGLKLLLVFLIFIISLFAFFYSFGMQNQDKVFNLMSLVNFAQMNDLRDTFFLIEKSDSKMLSAALEVVAQDTGFKKIYMEKNREKLFNYGQPLFRKFKNNYGITHFYFILPDAHVFVRLHDKDIYGDLVTRSSFQKARDTKKISRGIELGKTAYALRAVMPYYNNGELIGYVELGEEIGHFLKILKGKTNNEFAIIVDKEDLDREEWKSIRQAAGLRDNWDDSKKHLILSSTTGDEFAAKCFTEDNLERIEEGENLFPQLQINDRTFICGGFTLTKMEGRHTGAVLSLLDVTDTVAIVQKVNRAVLVGMIILSAIALTISIFVYRSVLKPIEKLKRAASEVGKGNLDTKIEVKSKDEIGELAQSFKQMTDDLKTTTVSRDRLAEEISRYNEAEETIIEGEERFRSVLEHANDAVCYVDSRGETIFWNRAAEKIFGYSAEEIVGKQVEIIIPEKYRQAHYDGMNRMIKTGKPQIIGKIIELSGLKKDGSEFPIELSLSNWKTKDNTYFTAIIRDISERKLSEGIIQRQVSRLSALRSIDKAIVGSLDLDVTLEVFLSHVTKELGVDAAAVLFLNKHTQMLEYLNSRGFRTNALKYTRLNLGESNAGRAAVERHIINIPDLRQDIDGFIRSEHFRQENFVSYFAVPLTAKGEVIGVLEIFHRSPFHIESEWAEFLEAIANQGAIALDNSFLFQDLQRSNVQLSLAYDRTIEGWAHALDLRDKETEGHSRRVTELTVRIAQEFGIKNEDLLHVRRGALLHDIGKMAIPDCILLKPGPLSEEEWVIMRLHPVYARDLLYPIEYLRPALDIPFSHHEKWDGTGYPTGLRGENIPLAARIFAVVDVWDALCSDRPYRPAWPKEKVKDFIRSQVGSHFDAGVVEIFLTIVK